MQIPRHSELPARFWNNVDDQCDAPVGVEHLGPCWEWRGPVKTSTYFKGRQLTPARAVHVDAGNPFVPQTRVVRDCANPACVRASHGIAKDSKETLGRLGLPARFWSQVIFLDDGCWEWSATGRRGWGSFTLDGLTRPAHRWAYAMARGLGDKDFLEPNCGHRGCLNPEHQLRREIIHATVDFKSIEDIPEHAWSKVYSSMESPHKELGECWIYDYNIRGDGYGLLAHGGRKIPLFHVTFAIANGVRESGLDIDHRCGQRKCVKPEHLRAVTRAENMQNLSGPHRDSTSGMRGVTQRADGTFSAEVMANGRRKRAHGFQSAEEAEVQAVAWRQELMPSSYMDRLEVNA